jgi:molybdenum cofactor cytidylyltransferase
MRLATLLLAAGGAKRMGCAKLLLPWGGSTVVGQALVTALQGPADQVVVVLGHNAGAVRAACETAAVPALQAGRLLFVENPLWEQGMFTSVTRGLAELPPGTDGFFVALGDMPLVPPAVYRQVAAAFTGQNIVVPMCEGVRGNPILFPVRLARGAAEPASRDEGLRSLLVSHPDRVTRIAVDEPGITIDLDTPEDYSRFAP